MGTRSKPTTTESELLSAARRLLNTHEVSFETLEPHAAGLSSDLFVVRGPSGSPTHVVKANTGFITRARAEAAALSHLNQRDMPGVPTLVGEEDGMLLLTWMNGDAATGHEDPSFFRDAGRWVATLHAFSGGEAMKLGSDPMPLGERLLSQLSKLGRRVESGRHRQLIRAVEETLSRNSSTLISPHRCVHRDLRAPNFLVGEQGEFVGVVDYEHAASTDPAWDFAKLEWWFFTSESRRSAFFEGYSEISEAPPAELIRLFTLHEAATLLAFFETRNAEYVDLAVETLVRAL